MSPSSWPSYHEEEVELAARVLRSNRVNYWTGDEGRQFETEFAEYAAAKHAIAVANGTVALDLVWRALGLDAGDEVIVTPRSFIASASSIVNAGATPVFVDVDRDSQNITAKTIAPYITPNTRAVCLVHLAGWPCDVNAIRAALPDRVAVVEDCAQAHGARIHGQPVGGLGDMAAWSFCQDKIMTTGGEGGMVTTNDKALWSRAWSYKDHGKSWEAVYERDHPPGFRWVHDSIGTNWRLTEMQAAIGRWQLKQMEAWTATRTRNAMRLAAAAESPVFRVPIPETHIRHAWYKFYAFVNDGALKSGWSRDRIVDEITSYGVRCMTGSCSEIYLEKAFETLGIRPATPLPVARELGESSLMLLVHPTMTDAELTAAEEALAAVGEASLK